MTDWLLVWLPGLLHSLCHPIARQDIHDEMADLLEDTNEIGELLSEGFGVDEFVDEADLLSELVGIFLGVVLS